MADVEKAESHSSNPDYDSATTHEDPGFEPIRTGTAGTRSLRNSRSMSRTRSHNGYSCDDYQPSDDTPQTEPEKDPFEVSFDGGDSDPMCPRSMKNAKKWLIVSIVSCASFCV